MMDCQFEAVIHGKDGLGCWAIEGKVIIHKSQCEVSLVEQDTTVCDFLDYIFNQAIVSSPLLCGFFGADDAIFFFKS